MRIYPFNSENRQIANILHKVKKEIVFCNDFYSSCKIPYIPICKSYLRLYNDKC